MGSQKAVLITGMAGFVGFHMARKMMAAGKTVVGIDNLNDYYDVQLKRDRIVALGFAAEDVREKVTIANLDNNAFFIQGHLEDDAIWAALASRFEVTGVIHLAAQAGVRYSLEQPKKYISSNVMGFLNVLEFCRSNDIKKLIYASSSSVYGMESAQPFSEDEACDKPVSLYAATKKSNELMAFTYHHLYGISSMGLRFFTVYGPWGRPDMAPFLFTKAAIDGAPIKVFNNGNQSRDFTYVDDIVQGVYQVFQQQEKITGAEVCNIGNGSPVPLMDFIEAIETAAGSTLKKEMHPAQPGDVAVTYADTQKLESRFGYAPATPLAEGIAQFVQWYRSYFAEKTVLNTGNESH